MVGQVTLLRYAARMTVLRDELRTWEVVLSNGTVALDLSLTLACLPLILMSASRTRSHGRSRSLRWIVHCPGC